MQTITFTNQWGREVTVDFRKGTYMNNGNLYVGAYNVNEEGDLEPYCNITVNFAERLAEANSAYLDTNNGDMNLFRVMVKEGYISPLYSAMESGFCTYPLYEFSQEFLDNVLELK